MQINYGRRYIGGEGGVRDPICTRRLRGEVKWVEGERNSLKYTVVCEESVKDMVE